MGLGEMAGELGLGVGIRALIGVNIMIIKKVHQKAIFMFIFIITYDFVHTLKFSHIGLLPHPCHILKNHAKELN